MDVACDLSIDTVVAHLGQPTEEKILVFVRSKDFDPLVQLALRIIHHKVNFAHESHYILRYINIWFVNKL